MPDEASRPTSPTRRQRAERTGVRWLSDSEDWLQERLSAYLGRRGWQAAVVPYTGFGSPHRLSVVARVLMRPEAIRAPSGRGSTWRTAVMRFLTAEVPLAEVEVTVGTTTHVLTTDREGHIAARVDVPGLAPGWHEITYRLAGGEVRRTGPALVVDPATPLGLVSDIDDTVIETGLTKALVAARNTFLVPLEQRRSVPGVAELYTAIRATAAAEVPVFYLSTGAWNLHGVLVRFLDLHGFPRGPLLLTDWGPTRDRVFRSGRAHKRASLRGLFAEHARTEWVLVGDTGQADPEVYLEIARELPGRVRAVYLRQLATAWRVRDVLDGLAELGVPACAFTRATEAAEHAYEIGLIDDAGLAAVRAADR